MTTKPVRIASPRHFHRLTHRLQGRMPMWVIYGPTTREYPGQWVARMHLALPEPRPTRFVITHDTLDELRELLPDWLVCVGRDPKDAPEIVEIWL